MTYNLYKNPMSRFAGVMAIMVFIITALLLILDSIGVRLNPIIGMLAYTLFPGLLFFYLLLIPIGMYREWRRRHRQAGVEPPAFPKFDFNIKSQRIQLYVFILGTSLVGLLVLAVSFQAFEFTESVHFCSELCHKVMEPEATTYRASPHARVECVRCHVGAGATWYVKSKLSGLYQIYSTLLEKYPRPIETPVHDLRPSSDTCEQCHWPTKFFGARQVVNIHYQQDEKNTPRHFNMLLNVGGGIAPTGIHWHVGQDEVYYIARDKKRQDIPWIKVKQKDGGEVIYKDSENPLKKAEIAKGEVRRMDCIDCHNRPTHIFKSPPAAMDKAIADGKIEHSLPYIKKVGVEALSKDYDSKEAAHAAIKDAVVLFYGEKYPKVATDRADSIKNAVSEIQNIWDANNFLHMKSKWSVYPDNIGHLIWPGCFRCHDDRHKNADGKAIKKDCDICHQFLGKPFEHPADVGGEEMRSPCTTCHQ